MGEKIEVAIDAIKAEQGANKVEDAFDDMVRSAKGAASSMDKSGNKIDKGFKDNAKSAKKAETATVDFKKVFVFAAAIGGVTALAAGVQALNADIDAIGKSASKAGVSLDFFQKLEFAGSQSGIEIASLEGSLKDLSLRMGQAAAGSAPMIKAFEDAGVSIRDTNGDMRTLEDVFPDVLDGIAALGSDSERAALGVQLMGESFTQNATLFRDGAGQFKELGDKAAELGIIMSDDTFAAAADLGDQMDILTRVIKVGFSAALTSITPILISTITFIQNFTTGIGKLTDKFKELIGLAEKNTFKGFTDQSENAKSSVAELTLALEGARKALKNLDEDSPAANAVLQTIENLKLQIGSQAIVEGNVAKEKQAIVEKNELALRWLDVLDAREESRFQTQIQNIGARRQAEQDALASQIGIGAEPQTEFAGAPERTVTQEKLQAETDLIAASFITQEELRLEALANERSAVQDALDQRVIDTDTAESLMTEISDRENNKRINIAQQAASLLIGGFASITRAFADESDMAFNIAKGFSVAEAIINGSVGFTKALAQGGILGFAGATSIALATAGQVATILRTQPGSGSSTTAVTGGVGLSNASAPQLQAAPQVNREENSGKTVNLFVNGFTNTDIVQNDLMPAIRTLIDENDEVLFSSGSRQSIELGLG